MAITRAPDGMRRPSARMKRDIDKMKLHPMGMKPYADRMRRRPVGIRRPPGPRRLPEWRCWPPKWHFRPSK